MNVPRSSVVLIVANVSLLVVHLALFGLGFTFVLHEQGVAEALGSVAGWMLFDIALPVLVAFGIADRFVKPGPNRVSAAICTALAIALPCCTLQSVFYDPAEYDEKQKAPALVGE